MSNGHTYSYPPTGYDDAQVEPVRRSAPASVHVVAIIGYVAGLALLVAGLAAGAYALGGNRYVEGRLGVDMSAVTGTGLTSGAVLVFCSLVTLVMTRKLQRGRQWVRVLVLTVAAVSVAGTLYDGLVGPGTANVLLGLVFPVIYVVLLNTPAARSWFRRRT
jgi:drug/metabolite transporter (DMT)-like permease